MPTHTFDLPDYLNIPADWDARLFVLAKLSEDGTISEDDAAKAAGVPLKKTVEPEDEVDDDPDSWFTLEQRKQFKENRRRLEEHFAKNPPKMSREEYLQLILNGPVATEEEVQAMEEIQEMKKRWKSPW